MKQNGDHSSILFFAQRGSSKSNIHSIYSCIKHKGVHIHHTVPSTRMMPYMRGMGTQQQYNNIMHSMYVRIVIYMQATTPIYGRKPFQVAFFDENEKRKNFLPHNHDVIN
jgi:hypothetical protein